VGIKSAGANALQENLEQDKLKNEVILLRQKVKTLQNTTQMQQSLEQEKLKTEVTMLRHKVKTMQMKQTQLLEEIDRLKQQ